MAEAPPSAGPVNVQAVLDKVLDDLVDYMEPVSVMDLLAQTETDVFKRSELRDIKEQSTTTTNKTRALLDCIRKKDSVAYDHFKQSLRSSGQEPLADMLEAAENNVDLTNVRKKLKTEVGQSPEKIKLFRELKTDLVAYYRKNESRMPVAPLAEQHDTELVNFYVRPPMMAYNKPNAFGQKKQLKEEKPTTSSRKPVQENKSMEDLKTSVDSYRKLIFKENDPYKNIYVTADAGMGKTSFSKMLAVTWCLAHDPDSSLLEKSNKDDVDTMQDDVDTMKEFDFLFLIHLREYQATDKCSLEDMVLYMLTQKLKRSFYTKAFLEQVLREKRCLIVADGLDEWAHPDTCQRGEVVPHISHYKGCSVLTTTRPWKLSTARLSPSSIDRHVEISQLDEDTSEKLESLAIKFLQENQNQQCQTVEAAQEKSREDFDEEVSKTNIGDIRYIPYILLQLICLWFEGSPLGRSMCEVYSNIIELNLSRWLIKTDSGHENCKCETPETETDIKCMQKNKHCRCYMWLLLKISEVAFCTLFNKTKEETLVFNKEFVKGINDSELTICLSTGLLSQVKDSVTVSEVRFKFYFPHKSLQEFFAALYITSNSFSNTRDKIVGVCKSVPDILEMSNVFKFVCGMKPEVYSCISRELQTVVDSDPSIIDYRHSIPRSDDAVLSSISQLASDNYYQESVLKSFRTVISYQNMQVDCLEESVRNGNDQCDIVLDDIILDEQMVPECSITILVNVAEHSVRTVKSLHIEDGFHRFLNITECQTLTKLAIVLDYDFNSDISEILKALKASTLKYLVIDVKLNVADEAIAAMTHLVNLQGLYFQYLETSHESMERLGEYISSCASLEQLCLKSITCSTHLYPCCPIELSKLSRLQYLKVISSLFIYSNTISLFGSIRALVTLTDLTLKIIYVGNDVTSPYDVIVDLSALNQLQHLYLVTDYISYFDVNADSLKTCTLDFLLAHSCIQRLFDCLGNGTALTDLTLRVVCQEHQYSCSGCSLNLYSQKMIRRIQLGEPDYNVALPLAELYVHTDRLTQCEITASNLSPHSISSLLADLNGAPVLESLTFSKFSHVPDRMDIPKLEQLKQFELYWCTLDKSILTLSLEMTSLKSLKLDGVTMSMTSWNELFLSISKLPQPISVTLWNIKMTTAELRELLFGIVGKLTKALRVSIRFCKLKREEWRNIVHDMKSSPAFSIIKDVFVDDDDDELKKKLIPIKYGYLEFETVK